MALRFSEALPDDDDDQPPTKRAPATAAPRRAQGSKSIYGASLEARAPERPAKPERPARSERPAKPERPARSERPAKPERPARSERRPARSERRPAVEDDADEPPRSDRRDRRKRGKARAAKREREEIAEKKSARLPLGEVSGGGFKKFNLSPELLKGLDDMGWEDPSDIQAELIPRVLAGSDVVGQARTGTGKTGAFAIPVLELYQGRGNLGKEGRSPKVLALTPTRELALQIEGQFRELGAYLKVRTVCLYGGAPLEPQFRALRNGADVVVGTPGRIMDHMRRGKLDLSKVACFVLDEADRMFDLGFRDDIYWIARRLPEEGRQTVLLSATVPPEVLTLAKEVTEDPEVVRTVTKDLTVGTVEQFYIRSTPSGSWACSSTSCPTRTRRRGSCSPAPSAARTRSPSACASAASTPARSTATCASASASRS
ncbi:MAG: DEAD/DEAH box helicase [Planctomycetota bacterium]